MAQVEALRAFSADHVARLTGLSKGQLAYWNKSGFFAPEHVEEGGRGPFSSIYSFQDVVGLKTISILRQHLTLQYLRKAAKVLSQYSDAPWSQLILDVWGKEVAFCESD